MPYPARPRSVGGAGSYLQVQAATHSSENACSRTACPDFDDIFSQTQGCRGRAKRRPAAGTGTSVPAPGGGGGAGTGQELHLRKLRGRPQLLRGMSGVLRIRSPVQGSVPLQESKATRLCALLGLAISLFFSLFTWQRRQRAASHVPQLAHLCRRLSFCLASASTPPSRPPALSWGFSEWRTPEGRGPSLKALVEMQYLQASTGACNNTPP